MKKLKSIKTVGELRKALKIHDDDAPIGLFSLVKDSYELDDVVHHTINAIETGWFLDSKKHPDGDPKTVNICFTR